MEQWGKEGFICGVSEIRLTKKPRRSGVGQVAGISPAAETEPAVEPG